MADLCMLYPDDDQEDHLWRDEIFTMIVGVCYSITFEIVVYYTDQRPLWNERTQEESTEIHLTTKIRVFPLIQMKRNLRTKTLNRNEVQCNFSKVFSSLSRVRCSDPSTDPGPTFFLIFSQRVRCRSLFLMKETPNTRNKFRLLSGKQHFSETSWFWDT